MSVPPKKVNQPLLAASSSAPASSSSSAPLSNQKQWKPWFPLHEVELQRLVHEFWSKVLKCTLHASQQLRLSSAPVGKGWFALPNTSTGLVLLKQYREKGEKLLVLHLIEMHGPKEFMKFATNAHLAYCVTSRPKLKAHVEKIYTQETQTNVLSVEKYADYIEALFYELWTAKRACKYIIDFLIEISQPSPSSRAWTPSSSSSTTSSSSSTISSSSSSSALSL